MEVKNKDLKKLIEKKLAIDITYTEDKKIREIKNQEKGFNEIAYSRGIYGCTGVLLQGRTTLKLYAIASRTSSLYSI